MVTVPLGTNAYKRSAAGSPEIRLENRYFERSPSNLREHSVLLSRPGNDPLVSLAGGNIRANFSKPGLLNSDLFTVSGPNLYRLSSTSGVSSQITGVIGGNSFVNMTWEKGIGYEYLFVCDGYSLQYFSEHARGTLTVSAGGAIAEGDVIQIGGVYYGWSATVDHNSPAGTITNPYWALLGSGGDTLANNTASLANMVLLLNYSGTPGVDFSSTVPGPNTAGSAVSNENTLTYTAFDNTTAGNSISTTVSVGGSHLSWGGTTLAGGGGTTLGTIAMPNSGEVPQAITEVSGYVLISVANSQKFYWLNPGELVIDPLNFAEKESNPDNIVDMLTIGDQAVIMGAGSTENWYATGQLLSPFAPQEGRVYQRGTIAGTAVVVKDDVVLVGDDGVVYSIGYNFGTTAQWGVHPISDSAIAERIRVTLRAEQGLSP